jgi:hypothetical protein
MIGFQLSTGEIVTARINQSVEFELNNAAVEDELVLGSHSLEVSIDDVDGNMNKLLNANRYDALERSTVFNDVRLMLLGNSQYQGKLVVRRIRENGVDAFLVLNGFSVDIINTMLTSVNFGSSVNLGSTPGDISTAAAAYVSQNYPDVDFNFPMIYAPNLYKGEAVGWNAIESVEPYDSDSSYDYQAVVAWTDGSAYVCIDPASAGESPDSAPAKWQELISNSIINNWIDSLSEFHFNDKTYSATQNAHAIAPQLYDKFVLKKIGSTFGYNIVGEFMSDAQTDQSMLLNTEVLDEVPTRVIVKAEQDAVYNADTNQTADVPGYPGVFVTGLGPSFYYLHFNNEILDPDDDWTVVDPTPAYPNPPSYYTIHSEGMHRFVFEIDIAVGATNPPYFLTARIGATTFYSYQFTGTGVIYHTFDWFFPSSQIGDKIGFELLNSSAAGSFQINPGSYIQIENLSANQYNEWNGTVEHANHVPDVTVGQYLLSLKRRFNLTVSLDFFQKTIRLDYCKNILDREPNDFTDIIQKPVADVQQPQGVTITENPQVGVAFSDGREFTVAATYSNYADMIDDTENRAVDDVVYLTNQFAYYRLTVAEDRTISWEFEANKLPPFIYGNGNRNINMIDAPAQMKYLQNDDDMVLLPWFNTEGNTVLFGGIENDKPIVHAIWYGLQDSENGDYQYPLASSSIYDATGADIGNLDLRFLEDLPESVWEKYWNDWVRKVDFSLEFESPADLNYKDIFELDFNAPIRRRFVKYVIKKVLYDVDQNGNIDAEIQAVKIQP